MSEGIIATSVMSDLIMAKA